MSVAQSLNYYIKFKLFGSQIVKWQANRAYRNFKEPKNWKSDILASPLKIGVKTKELITKHYLEGRYVNGLNRLRG